MVLTILLSIAKSLLLWVVLFAVGFTIVLFLVGKLALWHEKRQTNENVKLTPFIETAEMVASMKEVVQLLANDDPQVTSAIEELSLEAKLSYAQKWLPDIQMDDSDDYTCGDLLIFTLDSFGYLSFNDWKFSMEDLLGNLQGVLQHYHLPVTLFDAYPDKQTIIDPKEFPRIARYLPEDYALVELDTGGDDYVLTIGPTMKLQQAVDLAAGINNFSLKIIERNFPT